MRDGTRTSVKNTRVGLEYAAQQAAMPKLSKKSPAKKQRDAPRGPPRSEREEEVAAALPQVWLPVDLSTLQEDMGGNLQFVPGSAVGFAAQSPPPAASGGKGKKVSMPYFQPIVCNNSN